MPVPWMSPVCMTRPSLSENVSAPGAARRPNTDSRLTYSMSRNSGSVKPHWLTKFMLSVSDTVPASVGTSPTWCFSTSLRAIAWRPLSVTRRDRAGSLVVSLGAAAVPSSTMRPVSST